MRELKFINSDARPKETVLRVDIASIKPIMAWYGAYFSGDRYRVLVDGVKVEKDQNGELSGEVPPVLDNRPCTCHSDDNPPVPCARRYALSECLASQL